MLDNNERQVLDAIERQLSADDPAFTTRLGRFERSRGHEVTRYAWRVLGCVSVVLAIVALGVGDFGQFVVAGVLAALLLGLRNWRVHAS